MNEIAIQDDRLSELRLRAGGEHQATIRAVGQAVEHAVLAGVALLEAKTHVRSGCWNSWLEGAGIPEATAGQYMRLAFYRDELADLDAATSITRAYAYLKGMPPIGHPRQEEALRSEVRRLSSEGHSQREIASKLGVRRDTVRWHLGLPNTERHKAAVARSRRRAAERKRLERLEHAARERGGDIAKAYACVRSAALKVPRHGRRGGV